MKIWHKMFETVGFFWVLFCIIMMFFWIAVCLTSPPDMFYAPLQLVIWPSIWLIGGIALKTFRDVLGNIWFEGYK